MSCAEGLCRQIVTVSLSVSQPPRQHHPRVWVWGPLEHTQDSLGQRWRAHPSDGHQSPGRMPSGTYRAQLLRAWACSPHCQRGPFSPQAGLRDSLLSSPCNNQAVVLCARWQAADQGVLLQAGGASVPSLGWPWSGGWTWLQVAPRSTAPPSCLAGQQPQVQPCLCGVPC